MADPTADLSQGPVLLSFSLATASFALATTFVRFYVRRGIHGGFGADDYTSGAATIIALIATIFGILEGTAPDGMRALQFNVIGQPWYFVSATLSKISICLLFMGLLRRARQWRILLAGMVVVMTVINLGSALAVYLQCRPLEKVWNPAVAGGCSDPSIQVNFGYAQGAFSVFSWVFLALFPMLIIRDIARGNEPAWPFYATSSLSFVSGIFVIVRTAQTTQTTNTSIYTTPFFYASLMANLEQNLALTASNLLTLGPLFSSTTTTGTTTTTTTTSTTSSSTARRRKRRRDPYGSSSSAGTRRSTKSAGGKRTLTSRSNSSAGGVGGVGGVGSRIPSRAGSSRSITRPDTADTHHTHTHHGRGASLSSRGSSRHDIMHHHDRVGSRGSSRGSLRAAGGIGEDGLDGVDGGEIERKRSTHLIIEGPRAAAHIEDGDGDVDLEGGYDLGESRFGMRKMRGPGGSVDGYDSDSEEEKDDDGYDSDEGSDIDLEAWPRGIIKTVSVEVVEEVNEEYVAAAAAAAAAAKGNTGTNSGVGAAGVKTVGGSSKGIGRNSVVIVPGHGTVGGRQPRTMGVGHGGDNADRVSGGSGIEQDWEAMLRAGPPR